MAAKLAEGDSADDDLVALEHEFMRNERFTNDAVQDAAVLAKTVNDTLKSGNKIVAAMKAWFVL